MFKIGSSGGYAPVTVSLLAAVVLGRVLGLCGEQVRLEIEVFFQDDLDGVDPAKSLGFTYWPS
jgi:hypothetical protein